MRLNWSSQSWGPTCKRPIPLAMFSHVRTAGMLARQRQDWRAGALCMPGHAGMRALWISPWCRPNPVNTEVKVSRILDHTSSTGGENFHQIHPPIVPGVNRLEMFLQRRENLCAQNRFHGTLNYSSISQFLLNPQISEKRGCNKSPVSASDFLGRFTCT